MLVFTRKPTETVVILVGDKPIVVTLLGVQRDRARLGFEAPPEVPIHRGEIFALLQRDGRTRIRPQT